MDDEESATVMLQNFSDQEDGRMAKGQVLAQLNPRHSAISVIHGVKGRVVSGPQDIALYDTYELNLGDILCNS